MAEEKWKNGQRTENEEAVPDKMQTPVKQKDGGDAPNVSETWAQDTISDLDDFIESQGIYIRQ